jgi:hypothetical protein
MDEDGLDEVIAFVAIWLFSTTVVLAGIALGLLWRRGD